MFTNIHRTSFSIHHLAARELFLRKTMRFMCSGIAYQYEGPFFFKLSLGATCANFFSGRCLLRLFISCNHYCKAWASKRIFFRKTKTMESSNSECFKKLILLHIGGNMNNQIGKTSFLIFLFWNGITACCTAVDSWKNNGVFESQSLKI